MIGAIIGDIVGSVYEFDNIKTKEFPLLQSGSNFTDDTLMSIAVASALLETHGHAPEFEQAVIREMRRIAGKHPCPKGGYGGRFRHWLMSSNPKPYGSFGNGSAMRVSACGDMAQSLDMALELAERSAAVTHNHPEGIKGAQMVAAAIFMAKQGESKEAIRDHIIQHGYVLDETLDELRPDYQFDESCQGTVPQAITAFLESTSFEDALRNAVSLGGDCDTLSDITCAIAWPFYARNGVDETMRLLRDKALSLLPEELRKIVIEWESRYGGYTPDIVPTPPQPGLTELVFILDRSGSMSGMEQDTIGGFNSMIEKQKRGPGSAVVSTVLFDSTCEVIHDRVDIQHITPMTEEQYFVRGCTALLDAIGGAIHHIGNVHKYARPEDRPQHTMFVIATDGMENASRRYSSDRVKQMIQRQKDKYGWEFLFLGANIDAVETAGRFGIDADRAVNYHCDSAGTQLNYEVISEAICSVRCNQPLSRKWKQRIDEDYKSRKG